MTAIRIFLILIPLTLLIILLVMVDCGTATIFLSWVNSFGILIASGTAIWGIIFWKKEMIGKRKYQLSEDILSAFYESRVGLSRVRNPWTQGGERELIEKGTFEEKAALVYYLRVQNEKIFSKTLSLKYRFMAVYGKDNITPFDDLENILKDIREASIQIGRFILKDLENENEIYFGYKSTSKEKKEAKSTREKLIKQKSKYEVMLYQDFEKDDKIVARMNKTIENLEILLEA